MQAPETGESLRKQLDRLLQPWPMLEADGWSCQQALGRVRAENGKGAMTSTLLLEALGLLWPSVYHVAGAEVHDWMR